MRPSDITDGIRLLAGVRGVLLALASMRPSDITDGIARCRASSRSCRGTLQ